MKNYILISCIAICCALLLLPTLITLDRTVPERSYVEDQWNGRFWSGEKSKGNYDFHQSAQVEHPAAIPQPMAVWLLGAGLVALSGITRRRKRTTAVSLIKLVEEF